MRTSTNSRTNSFTSAIAKRFSFRKSFSTDHQPSERRTQRISLNNPNNNDGAISSVASFDPDALAYSSFPLRTESCIRVLDLHPSDFIASPLHGTLRSVDLRDATALAKEPYACLSYCWGSPNRTELITVDHKKLRITAQLRDALRRVRERGCRTIWADQICIDQENVAEKNAQVRMMGEVYGKGSWTFAYLGEMLEGEKGEREGFAMECLKRIESVGVRYTDMRRVDEGKWQEVFEEQSAQVKGVIRDYIQGRKVRGGKINGEKFGRDNNGAAALDGEEEEEVMKVVGDICAIALRPYFRRMWIVQELVKSGPERLEFVLGSHTLGMSGVRALHLCIKTELDSRMRSGEIDKRTLSNAARRTSALLDALNADFNQGPLPGRNTLLALRTVYSFSSRLECANPRDRFFAIRDLLADEDAGNSNLPAVDYSRSVRDVYIDHSCYIFAHSGQEGVLYMLSSQLHLVEEQHDVPSWCFGRSLDEDPDRPARFASNEENACKPHKFMMGEIDKVRGIMSTRGSFVGEVMRPPHLPKGFRIQRLHDSRAPKFIVALCESLAAHYWQLWPIPKVRAYQVALDRIKLTFVSYVKENANDKTALANTKEAHPFFQVQQYSPDVSDPKWEDAFAKIFEETFEGEVGITLRIIESVVLPFITKEGFVGFGCGETREGDFVAVLAGVKCPVILRPKGEMYRLLWRAEVGGIMQGEVFSQMKRDLETIEIC